MTCWSYNRSTGHSINTGPGTPVCATRNASQMAGTRSLPRFTARAHFTWGLNNANWSMSCSAPRPCSIVAAAPPSITTGDCASCAFFTAVIVLVTPGPAVTAAMPGTPVIRATASAAKTAVASWRTSTTRMPRSLAPLRIGEMCPPHSVNRNSTPWDRSTRAIWLPPFMSRFRWPLRPCRETQSCCD